MFFFKKEYEDDLKYAQELAKANAALVWRFSQGVYQFKPEIKNELLSAKIPDIFPLEIFKRIPEWGVYIEIEDEIGGQYFYGFYAYIDLIDGRERLILLIDFVYGGEDSYQYLPIELDQNVSIIEAIITAVTRDVPIPENVKNDFKDWMPQIKSMLSLLIYICQDEPEIEARDKPNNALKPAYNYPKKVKEGFKLFMPDKPRIWRVGEKISRIIREAKGHTGGGGKKSPHLRRAHWHGYYKGKKGEEKVFFFKFLPIIGVNIEGD
jgi:hypothetical protein